MYLFYHNHIHILRDINFKYLFTDFRIDLNTFYINFDILIIFGNILKITSAIILILYSITTSISVPSSKVTIIFSHSNTVIFSVMLKNKPISNSFIASLFYIIFINCSILYL